MDVDRAEQRAFRAQRILEAYQSVRRLPTIVASVLDDGRPVWSGFAGAAVAPATQFRMGSITKTMTGVLVLQCRDDGLLDLDDRLARFVPESGYGDATLRELLSHTSGMQSEPAGPWWERTPGTDFPTLCAANDGSGAVFARGTTYHYSNLAFALLGEVVARVRAASWDSVLGERLLEPLQLRDTTRAPRRPAATGFSVDHLRGTLAEEPAHDTGAMAPAGQLWSTVDDLARFLAFLRSGDDAVLGVASLREMQRPVREDYGLATFVVPWIPGGPDARLVGHLGSMPGFQGCALIDPDSGAGLVALTNATTGFAGVELAERMLGAGAMPAATTPWVPTTAVPAWAEELLGSWYWGHSAYEARYRHGLLELHDVARHRLAEQFDRRSDGSLVGVAGYHHGETLRVRRSDDDGSVAYLECATFVYTRRPYDDRVPIPGGPPLTGPATPSSC